MCPWNDAHRNRSAFVAQLASGALAAGCHHAGCQGNGWHELRDAVEPGWRERRDENAAGNCDHRGDRKGRESPGLAVATCFADVQALPVEWL